MEKTFYNYLYLLINIPPLQHVKVGVLYKILDLFFIFLTNVASSNLIPLWAYGMGFAPLWKAIDMYFHLTYQYRLKLS